jgi:hypothetical protein
LRPWIRSFGSAGSFAKSFKFGEVQGCTCLPGENCLSLAPAFEITSDKGDAAMKKPTAKIRDEIARLQEQLKQAETRDAERIGRVALKAGLGEIEIDEVDLLSAFEEIAGRFRTEPKSTHKREPATTPQNGAVEASGQSAEA